MLATAADDTAAALQELRDLAQGIHPAILTEAGLAPALETLADEAPLPVELHGVETGRYPPGVETTAFVAAVEAIDDAARRGATFVQVRVERRSDRLVLLAEDDGRPRSAPMIHLADRVGALAGTLAADPNAIRVELPCE